MQATFSPALESLINQTQEILGTEVVLHRQQDAPWGGMLLDMYTYETGKNIIVYPFNLLGMLKDVVIARKCAALLLKGVAAKQNELRVLSFDDASAAKGMSQIYLDTLKDEETRAMPPLKKRKLSFYLYLLVHENLSEVPIEILADIYLFTQYPPMRNPLVYFLIRESLNDMHGLMAVHERIPKRYFVVHNAMYFARDMYYAEAMSAIPLNPIINIPEMEKFKNLDLKEMMSSRWRQSPWYHTKVVGDFLHRKLVQLMAATTGKDSVGDLNEYFRLHTHITNRWIEILHMTDWYPWQAPSHLRNAMKQRQEIEDRVAAKIFS